METYLGFLAGQLAVVVVSWAYWITPERPWTGYLRANLARHVGDAGLALFVLVAWVSGMLGQIATWFGMADLATKIPDSPEGIAGGFVAGGVTSIVAWVLHARWKKRAAQETGP